MKKRFTLSLALFIYLIVRLLISPKGETYDNSFNHSEESLFKDHHIIGSNLFLHEIKSGTCSTHGLKSIISSGECVQAARLHGYQVDTIINTSIDEYHDKPESCLLNPLIDPSVRAKSNVILLNTRTNCNPALSEECQCKESAPCFCKTNNFIQIHKTTKESRNAQVDGQFIVTWALNLGGQDSLLDSAFLKAGFEQSVKDYINNDILCSDDLSVKGAEFFGVEIVTDDGSNDKEGKKMAISGNGMCKGDIKRCQKPVQLKKKIDNEESESEKQVMKATQTKKDFCEVFLSSTIFDAFKEKIVTASGFKYDLDVGVIADLEGNLDLKYEVKFKPNEGDGLNQIDDVGLDPAEPIRIDPICTQSQCLSQREVMRNIFIYFNIPFDENKHECLYQGINCNAEDLVTHIWMINYGFPGKSIPTMFGSLPSLNGLLLGGNELVGSIPSEFSRLRNLELLWLENNLLTGTIPSEIGNLKALLELNLFNNLLSGVIPTEFDRLMKLEMLNLGKNQFNKQIPNFQKPKEAVEIKADCVSFTNPFNKIFKKMEIPNIFRNNRGIDLDIGSLTKLKSLTISDNFLNGTIPSEFSLFPKLESLDIGANEFTGTIPSEITQLSKLKVLDCHDNFLVGSIPKDIGRLSQLEILNLHGNKLSGNIPPSIGRLNKLNELVLDENQITGSLPPELCYLAKLKYLTFGQNRMNGNIPTELGKLTALENFDLRNYSLSFGEGSKRQIGTIPSELGLLTSWKHVVFLNNSATGTIPRELGNITGAKSLWLKNLGVSGPLPTELGKLESLAFFSVGGNDLNGTIPKELSNMSSLEALDIGDNKLSGEIPTEIGNLTTLKFIQLGKNEITGKIPSEFGNLLSLENLHIANSNLSGEIPVELSRLENLTAFEIAGNEIGGMFPVEITVLVTIQNLDCGENNFTGTIPEEIENLENLMRINFGSNNFTGTIPKQIANLNFLQDLILAENSLTGTIHTEFGNLGSLVVLDLKNNSLSGSIPSELGNIQTLQTIDLGSNDLTFTIPSQIADIAALTYLDISRNELTGRIPSILEQLVANGSVTFIPDDSYVITYPSTFVPSLVPTLYPSGSPSIHPSISAMPSIAPTTIPSIIPSLKPSTFPSIAPTTIPSIIPSLQPSNSPTVSFSGLYPPAMSAGERFGFSVGISNTVIVAGSPLKGVGGLSTVGMVHLFSSAGDYLANFTAQKYVGNITVDDTAATDRFGYAVACSDTHFVVSAPYDDEVTSGTGSAYLYKIDGTLIAKVPSTLPQFGGKAGLQGLAIDDNKFLLGQHRYNGIKGAVMVFDLTGSEMFQLHLNDATNGDNFGYAVDCRDGHIVVGAYRKLSTGVAYIFSDTGTQIARLDPSVSHATMYFGFSVGVSNDKVVVGSPYYDGQKGAVFVYSTDGTFLRMINGANDTLAFDRFGQTVAISDAQDKIFVGAPFHDSGGTSSGAVYVFRTDGTLLHKQEGAHGAQQLGLALAASDTRGLVGAFPDKQFLGSSAAGGIFLL